MIRIRSAAHSDIGRVREENEDRYLHDENAHLYGVADGVGGLPGGAEAAQLSVEAVDELVRATPTGATPDLVQLTRQTNQRVHDLGLKLSPVMGLGSTLTFGHIWGSTLQIAHVGDSRCYGLREGKLEMLTEDHSVENEARQRRAKGEVVHYHEANRNALTRCIGQPTPLNVDLISRPLEPGDRYFFCTDGVTRMIRDSELAEMIAKPGEPETVLRAIIDLAVRRGGPDNATGVLLYIDGLE
ncbi:MAG: serine/threonine-protein phosphatase [Verrucomicrobia bacterium]|nr:serine/threonine-protein phosphatase [Verrucomicrobiota bacterium]